MLNAVELFDLSKTNHAAIFDGCTYAWEVLPKIASYVDGYLAGKSLLRDGAQVPANVFVGDRVYIGEGTVLEPGVMIKGPAIIGRNCRIGHNAYIRENVIVGDGCVVGNSCELKNCLLLNEAQVPHFNYVGDSVLGYKAHLGAGAILSNLKLVPGNIAVHFGMERFETGLRKFGALVGDEAQIGCNAVLNPGSVIGRRAVVYPGVVWRGTLLANQVVRNHSDLVISDRRG